MATTGEAAIMNVIRTNMRAAGETNFLESNTDAVPLPSLPETNVPLITNALTERMNDVHAALSVNVGNRALITLLIVLIAFALNRLISLILKSARKRLERPGHHIMDEKFFDAVIQPMSFLVFPLAYFACVWIWRPSGTLGTVMNAGGTIIIGWVVAFYIIRFIQGVGGALLRIQSRDGMVEADMGAADTFLKIAKFFVICVTALFVADAIGFNVKGVIAGLGIGGLAVALAAQDTLANFFGSITVLLDRPFKMGDRVKTLQYDGFVQRVGLRSTRILTLDGNEVAVPNKELATASIENVARRPSIKYVSTIYLDLHTSVARVKEAIEIVRGALSESPELLPDYYVNFVEIGTYALTIRYVYWVAPPDYWQSLNVTQTILLQILERFERAGIRLAYPTQTLRSSEAPVTEGKE